MSVTKQISTDEWPEYLSLFSNANKGRRLMLKSFNTEKGDVLLSDGSPLFAVDYDPVHKGNDLVISLGKTEIEYSHIIKAPVELHETPSPSGQIKSLEIIDQNQNKIVLDLE